MNETTSILYLPNKEELRRLLNNQLSDVNTIKSKKRTSRKNKNANRCSQSLNLWDTFSQIWYSSTNRQMKTECQSCHRAEGIFGEADEGVGGMSNEKLEHKEYPACYYTLLPYPCKNSLFLWESGVAYEQFLSLQCE